MNGKATRRRTGGEIVAAHLRDLGIRHAFSLPGSQVLPIWDGICRNGGIEIIVPRTERSGAFMAEGYALASGWPAVVIDTLGPGVANELLSLRSAQLSGASVMYVAPFHPAAKRARLDEVFQGLDHVGFFAGVCKGQWLVDRASDLTAALDHALSACLDPPTGPARVDISFPLLFGRHRCDAPSPTIPAGARSPASEIRVTETASPTGGSGSIRLAPGIGVPGFAVPFAFGAKLARPGTPVTVECTWSGLMRNLDTLAVARMHGVSVRLVTDGLVQEADDLAATFSIELARRDAPDTLTILCRQATDEPSSVTASLATTGEEAEG